MTDEECSCLFGTRFYERFLGKRVTVKYGMDVLESIFGEVIENDLDFLVVRSSGECYAVDKMSIRCIVYRDD